MNKWSNSSLHANLLHILTFKSNETKYFHLYHSQPETQLLTYKVLKSSGFAKLYLKSNHIGIPKISYSFLKDSFYSFNTTSSAYLPALEHYMHQCGMDISKNNAEKNYSPP